MLKQLYVKNLSDFPDTDWKFVPGLTVITGPIGSGKTLRDRDVLFHLLSGRIPSKRTIDCFGKGLQAGVVLEKDSGESLSIMRSGSNIRILEDKTAEGSAGVKERVAIFTGIPASDLAELCYCSGMKLQAGMQLPSALLTTMRAAMGDGISQYAKIVSAEVSATQARITANSTAATAVVDVSEVQTRLEQAQQQYAELVKEQEAMTAAVETSRQVLGAELDFVVEDQIKQARAALGALVRNTCSELEQLVKESYLYDFCRALEKEWEEGCIDAVDGLITIDNFLPTLGAMLERSRSLTDLKLKPDQILPTFKRWQQLQQTPTVSQQQRQQAQAYLDYFNNLGLRIQAARDAVVSLKQQLDSAATQAERNEKTLAQLKSDRKFMACLEVLQSCVMPSGKQSVEKQMIEAVSQGTMAAATDYLCLCGMKAKTQYDAGTGITLLRKDGEIKVQELSEGESMITALCLRLAIAHTLKPVPFLVLDDITGSLGVRAEVVTDMLRVFAREHNIPILLNTQELRVTGDTFYRVDRK